MASSLCTVPPPSLAWGRVRALSLFGNDLRVARLYPTKQSPNQPTNRFWRHLDHTHFPAKAEHTHRGCTLHTHKYIYIYWLCTTFVVRACVCVCAMDLSEMKWGYGATITQLGAVNSTPGHVLFTRQCTAIILLLRRPTTMLACL